MAVDLVLFGATGVTGRAAVPYLARRADELGLSWAVAGRDPQRLQRLVADLPDAGRPGVVEADLRYDDTLDALVRVGRVLLNAVGPYRDSAPLLLPRCVTAGTHYLDLSGELDHVARMVAEHHDAATTAGVALVQVAGFESIPFDLAVAAAADRALARGERLRGADVELTASLPPGLPRPSDGISGGTYASLLGVLRDADAAVGFDPACLLDDEQRARDVRRSSPVTTLPRVAGTRILAPMAPSPFLNPPVVHRTDSLRREEGRGHAEGFRYREGVAVASGVLTLPLQAAVATPVAAFQTGLRAVATLAPQPVRRLAADVLAAVGPAPGDGPSPDRLEGWRWRLDLRAPTTDDRTERVTVDGAGHPGYLATSRMLAEAGLLLADPDTGLPPRGGHVTPAVALGTDHLARFDHAGVRFVVDGAGGHD